MSIKDVHSEWEELARHDALWAILTEKNKLNKKWDEEEFFKTGVDEIQQLLNRCQELPGWDGPTGLAVDFGCGVGRLTQALAQNFDRAIGIDISETMIEYAKKANAHVDRCQYILNQSDSLDFLDDSGVNFIYSRIVFQHMPQELAKQYISQFCRKLAPSGLFVFQVPSSKKKKAPPRGWQAIRMNISASSPGWFKSAYRRMRGRPVTGPMSMYTIPRHEVQELISENGLVLLAVDDDYSAPSYDGFVYIATRSP